MTSRVDWVEFECLKRPIWRAIGWRGRRGETAVKRVEIELVRVERVDHVRDGLIDRVRRELGQVVEELEVARVY